MESKIRLTRDMEEFVFDLLESRVLQNFEENSEGELTFADACRFWGISENMASEGLDARLQQVKSYLTKLDYILADADAELSIGRLFTGEEVRYIVEVQRRMESRFDRHLNLLRTRLRKH